MDVERAAAATNNNNLIITNNNTIDDDQLDEKQQIAANNNVNDKSDVPTDAQQPHLKKHRKVYLWIKQHLWIFPFLLFLLLIAIVIVPYLLSLKYELVDPLLPYVSDSGGLPPAAIIFSCIIDLIALLVLIIAWIRYKQIKFYLNDTDYVGKLMKNEQFLNRLHRYNRRAYWFQIGTALFAIGVGNVRTTEYLTLHSVLALLMFLCSLIAICLQTHLARILYREFSIESRPLSMLLITIVSSISFVVCVVCEIVNRRQVGDEKFTDYTFRMHWPDTDQESYIVHCVGTGFEWLMIVAFSFYYLCVCRRFRVIG